MILIRDNRRNVLDVEYELCEFSSIALVATGALFNDFFVVQLQSSQILPGLGELSLLHAFRNIPVDKGTLVVHDVELVIQPCPGFANRSCVGQCTNGPRNLGQVPTRDNSRWLVVDPNLETSWTPVDKLDCALFLQLGDRSIDISGHDITPVQEADGHVLAILGIALDHLVPWLKTGGGDFFDACLLMHGFLGCHNWRIGDQGKVDPRIWNQVVLELIEVYIEGTLESQRGCDRGHNLGNDPVEVGVCWPVHLEVSLAQLIDGLIVHQEGHVSELQAGVGGQDGIVGFDDGWGHLSSWIDDKLQLGLFGKVRHEAVHQQGCESRPSATSKSMEHNEALKYNEARVWKILSLTLHVYLKASALFSHGSDLVHCHSDLLLANGIVSSGIVVGSILLARDEGAGMEQVLVGAGLDLVNH